VPSQPPAGEPAPRSGALPAESTAQLGQAPFGVYLHVPFCLTRCGYCDFTTYTADELGPDPGASRDSWADAAIAELRLARLVLGDTELPVQTVFVGGGTPTLLPPSDLGRVVTALDDLFGLADDVELTTEANPESVSPRVFSGLREAGFTRVSLGMQSTVPHVLRVLDRVHTPGRAVEAATEARSAGFDHVNLDLIYGTPGESQDDFAASLDAALQADPDHISAYALLVEEGTRMAAQVRRGTVAPPDDDDQADKYLLADDTLASAGMAWYEVSNWARDGVAGARCRHNELYWTSGDWWGVGPGAHSHIRGTRWWNVRHPAPWSRRLAAGESPAHGREVLDAETQRVERVLLEVRLAAGLSVAELDDAGKVAARQMVEEGLVEPAPLGSPGAEDAPDEPDPRVVLTQRGRLLADTVVHRLLP